MRLEIIQNNQLIAEFMGFTQCTEINLDISTFFINFML